MVSTTLTAEMLFKSRVPVHTFEETDYVDALVLFHQSIKSKYLVNVQQKNYNSTACFMRAYQHTISMQLKK